MLTVSSVSKSHGSRTLFRDVTFRLQPGRRIALVGGNGVGKTTLLEIVVGLHEPDTGDIHRPKDLKVGYLPQELVDEAVGTVLEEVMGGAEDVLELERELRRLEHEMSESSDPALVDRYGDAQSRYEHLGGYALEAQARSVLSGLGFADSDAERSLASMSGGWRMRAALARLVLAEPDVLVLDEPTNHLDTDSVAWLEEQLAQWRGAILFVSHDRDFIDAVAERVIEIAGGVASEYVGGFAEFVVQREERMAQIRSAAANQARQVAATEKFIERFRYKATKARQVQSRIKTLEKLDRIEVPDHKANVARFSFPQPQRSARLVAEFDDASLGYDGVAVLKGVSLAIERGERWGIVGPNGAGKSTLLKTLLGTLVPISGTVQLGAQVDVAYFAQHQVDALDLNATVEHEFRRAVGDQPKGRNLRTVLGGFGFSGDAVDRLVGSCSGGERTRLALAEIMCNPVNLLVLDEPTNHLDLPSCDVLEDALDAYPGTVLVVSHDRHLVRNVAQGLLEVRNGVVKVHREVSESVLSPRHAAAAGAQAAAVAKAEAAASKSRDASAGRSKAGKASKASKASKVGKVGDRRNAPTPAASSLRTASSGGAGPAPVVAAAPSPKSASAPVDSQARHRAVKELRRKVEKAERDLSKAEAEVADLQSQMADPEVYADPEKIKDLAVRHDAAKDRAVTAMDSWMEAGSELEALS